jgi:hypothetical protein
MKRLKMRRAAALATGLALALSFPTASSVANKGGVPHSQKPCKAKKKGKKHAPRNDNGKKCGFNFPG